MKYMTGVDGFAPVIEADGVAEQPFPTGGTGWLVSDPTHYDRPHALDTAQLFAFLIATQPEKIKKLGIGSYRDKKDMARLKFFARRTETS